MSKYLLLHDESNCIGCLACEVHCKTNKDLGPGPDPCKIIASGPVEVDGLPRMRFEIHALLPLRGPVVREGLPDRHDAPAEDGIVFVESSVCVGCKSCITACPWGTPQSNQVTRKVVKCDYCKDRVDVGLQPTCVTKCVTGCLSFGEATEVPDPRHERYARQMMADPTPTNGGQLS